MNRHEFEELFIQSLDENLDASDLERLDAARAEFPELAAELESYKRLRELAKRSAPATFGPYFAQKVITRIEAGGLEIERLIAMFFRKYQLAALGIITAWIALNIFFSERLDVPELLGIEETMQPADEDLLSFDLYDEFARNEQQPTNPDSYRDEEPK